MTDLERLTTAFRAINPWARKLLEELALGFVEDFSAAKSAPTAGAIEGAFDLA
jgi:hypothetical protein